MRKASNRRNDDSDWYRVEYTAPGYQGGICASCGEQYDSDEPEIPFCDDCLDAEEVALGEDGFDELGWSD